MTENSEINPELQKAVLDLAQNMDTTEAEKRRVQSQYSMGTPFLAQPLNARQKKAKVAKRKAVKAARNINRRK